MPDTPFQGPPLQERLTQQLAAQGHVKDPTAMALALLRARGQAKDRAATRTGHAVSDFSYDKKTNAATLKSRKPWGR